MKSYSMVTPWSLYHMINTEPQKHAGICPEIQLISFFHPWLYLHSLACVCTERLAAQKMSDTNLTHTLNHVTQLLVLSNYRSWFKGFSHQSLKTPHRDMQKFSSHTKVPLLNAVYYLGEPNIFHFKLFENLTQL